MDRELVESPISQVTRKTHGLSECYDARLALSMHLYNRSQYAHALY
jgi:hypothetical protein